ncbi:MAG: hypothetical protein E6G20_04615 [Actinobacteria bacterium]|nr:MAG: hypothetical protein E6G20_04615 [Actinomycetota bacterium]
MYGKAHKIRSTVSAIALAASVALIAIPAAQAGNTLVDDYFRDAQPQNTLVDDYFRDAQPQNSLVDDYFRDTAATAKPVAQVSLSSSDSVNWGKVGIGIIAVCGLLLLVALGMGARQLRHSGHGLGSA